MAFDALMILGPTASGKTDLSLRLAARLPVEIISVDSALVYRGMDIGTAKPSLAERTAVPHHLIDVREISQPYSVADFLSDAVRLVGEIQSRGCLPVLAGGTMLYANALRQGLAEIPAVPGAVRQAVLEEGADRGWPAMHGELAKVDPETARRLPEHDRQRISRALEVYRATGRPLSSYLSQSRQAPELDILTVALVPGDRSRLHRAIAERFDGMLEAGLMDEVRRLAQTPGFSADSPAMRAVGYRQALECLAGETTPAQFRERAIAATRQLAKRQITWLRSMDGKVLFDPYSPGMPESALSFLASQEWKTGRESRPVMAD